MDIRDEIKKRKKEGWIEAWLAVEVLAVSREVAVSSLERHVESLSKADGMFAYEKSFHDCIETKSPVKNVEKAYSCVADVKLFAKDIISLVNMILVYGPSSVEIISPDRKEIKIEEMQNMCNLLASLVHQFASVGIGGIVISQK